MANSSTLLDEEHTNEPKAKWKAPEVLRDWGFPTRTPLTSRWRKLRGYRCHVRSSFSDGGTPFVLVHGLIISSLYMIPLAEELATTSEVHAVDLPGFGRSGGPNCAPSIEASSEFLRDWLDAEGIERCHLVANSLGCQICAAFAARFPSRIASLVLIGATIDSAAHTLLRQMVRLFSDIRTELPRLWVNYAVDLIKAGPIRTVTMVRQMFRDHIELRLPNIHCPTLLLRGEFDPIAPQCWLDRASARLPDGRSVSMDSAGHAAHFTRPEFSAKLIRQFIKEYYG